MYWSIKRPLTDGALVPSIWLFLSYYVGKDVVNYGEFGKISINLVGIVFSTFRRFNWSVLGITLGLQNCVAQKVRVWLHKTWFIVQPKHIPQHVESKLWNPCHVWNLLNCGWSLFVELVATQTNSWFLNHWININQLEWPVSSVAGVYGLMVWGQCFGFSMQFLLHELCFCNIHIFVRGRQKGSCRNLYIWNFVGAQCIWGMENDMANSQNDNAIDKLLQGAPKHLTPYSELQKR